MSGTYPNPAVSVAADDLLETILTDRWPCPMDNGAGRHWISEPFRLGVERDPSVDVPLHWLEGLEGPIVHDACVAVAAEIERDLVDETAPGEAFPIRRVVNDCRGFVEYRCGVRRHVDVDQLYAELMRSRWDPDIAWAGGYRPDGVSFITGSTVCYHGHRMLDVTIQYTDREAGAVPALEPFIDDLKDRIRRGIVLERCDCLDDTGRHRSPLRPDSMPRVEPVRYARFHEVGAGAGVHVDRNLVGYALGFGYDSGGWTVHPDLDPHRGEWLDRPEILERDLRLTVGSEYTATPEESVVYDGGAGATLEDLGISLESRIDHAAERIDRVLKEIRDEDEPPEQ